MFAGRFHSPAARGLAAFAGSWLVLALPEAAAQSQRPEITRPDIAPPPTLRATTRPAELRRPVALPPAPRQSTESEPEDASILPETREAYRTADPESDGEREGEETDTENDEKAPASQTLRRAKIDGDLSEEAPPPIPEDGKEPIEPLLVPVDGDHARINDMTAALPVDEEVDPERLGRPITPRRFGLYQPLGIRMGSFLFHPEAETNLVHTDNLFRSAASRQADTALEIAPRLRVTSDWSRHAIEARVEGLRSYHERFESEDDRKITASLRGRIDVTRKTNVAADLSYDYGQETRGSLTGPALNAPRANIETRRAALEGNHRFNRLSLQIRGARTEYDYSNETGIDDRSYTQDEAGTRIGYEFVPGVRVFVDGSANRRKHETAALADGILRDSTGTRVRAGIALDIRGTLKGEASLGWAQQKPDDARLRPTEGLILDSSLTWRPTGLTEFILSAKSDVAESDAALTSGALSRQAAIEVRHALQRNLILLAGLSYAVTEYTGTPVTERVLKETLGTEYYLSREVALTARYQHTNFFSTTPGADYTDNEVRVGVKIRR
ncbi:MAG: outer membrane beta-barrel protein [Hyphomicrobiaceae bacterium]|nr:MAG: outer membrane beta-barrel protein [Hyphomicrobiaceae bacterium]